MNKQSETGLVMVFPLVLLFVLLSPFFINLLYSSEFYSTNDYTDYAIIGTVFIVVSNCMGMILLAKQAAGIFIWSVLGQRLVLIVAYLWGYTYFGLKGLGFSYIATGALNFFLMIIILNHFYRIRVTKRVLLLLLTVILSTIAAIIVRKIDFDMVRYPIGFFLVVFSVIFSFLYMKNKMNIDICLVLKNKFKK